MAATAIFAYIFLGLAIVLYIVGIYHSFSKPPKVDDASFGDAVDKAKAALEEARKAMEALAKLGKGVQFTVMGTVAAVIGLYLLSI